MQPYATIHSTEEPIIVDGGRRMPEFAKAIYDLVKDICNVPNNINGKLTVPVKKEQHIEQNLYGQISSRSYGRWTCAASDHYGPKKSRQIFTTASHYSKTNLPTNAPFHQINSYLDQNGYTQSTKPSIDFVAQHNNKYYLLEIKFPQNHYLNCQCITGSDPTNPKYTGEKSDWNWCHLNDPNFQVYNNTLFEKPFYEHGQSKIEYMTDVQTGLMLIDFIRVLSVKHNNGTCGIEGMYFSAFFWNTDPITMKNHSNKPIFCKKISEILSRFIDNRTYCLTQNQNGNVDIWKKLPCKLSYFDGTLLDRGTPKLTEFVGEPIKFLYDSYDPDYNTSGTLYPSGLFCFLIKVEPL